MSELLTKKVVENRINIPKKNIAEIDNLIDDYHDMLDYLKESSVKRL